MKFKQEIQPLALVVTLAFSGIANADDNKQWSSQVIDSVKTHPLVASQAATLAAQQARANGKRKSLYNPELSTGYEKEGSQNNYQVGLSQTIDWWDKSDVLGQSADYEMVSAQLEYDVVFISTMADLLRAIIRHSAAQQRFDFSSEQEKRVYSLIEQIKARRKVGDLGQIDSQLALLNLSKNFNLTAQTIAQFEQAKMNIKRLLPNSNQQVLTIPQRFWSLNLDNLPTGSVNNHPKILLAQSQWNEQRTQAKLTKLTTKGDPTLGFTVGRNGRDNTVGINLSMPLNVRNDYSDSVISAQKDALSLEVLLQNTVNNQVALNTQTRNVVASYQQRFSYQKNNGLLFSKADNEETITLLIKQWNYGDVNTADYLNAMNQVVDGWVATIDLQASYQIAIVDYLEQSGLLVNYVSKNL